MGLLRGGLLFLLLFFFVLVLVFSRFLCFILTPFFLVLILLFLLLFRLRLLRCWLARCGFAWCGASGWGWGWGWCFLGLLRLHGWQLLDLRRCFLLRWGPSCEVPVKQREFVARLCHEFCLFECSWAHLVQKGCVSELVVA